MYFGTLNSIPKKKKKIKQFWQFFRQKIDFWVIWVFEEITKEKIFEPIFFD